MLKYMKETSMSINSNKYSYGLGEFPLRTWRNTHLLRPGGLGTGTRVRLGWTLPFGVAVKPQSLLLWSNRAWTSTRVEKESPALSQMLPWLLTLDHLVVVVVSKLPFCCHGDGLAAGLRGWTPAGFLPVPTSRRSSLERRYGRGSMTALHALVMVSFSLANGRSAAAERDHRRRLLVAWNGGSSRVIPGIRTLSPKKIRTGLVPTFVNVQLVQDLEQVYLNLSLLCCGYFMFMLIFISIKKRLGFFGSIYSPE